MCVRALVEAVGCLGLWSRKVKILKMEEATGVLKMEKATGVVGVAIVDKIVNKLEEIVERSLKYESSAQNLASEEQELRPLFEEIEELASMAGLPSEEIQRVQEMMAKMRQARLEYSKIPWWKIWRRSSCQEEIEKVDQQVKEFISYRLSVQMQRNVLEILHILQTWGAGQTTNQPAQPQILKSDLAALSQSTVELRAPLKNKLRSYLMKDDGDDQVLNLTGLAGSGKTTLALQLCTDPLVRDWFEEGSIFFVSVGLEIKSRGYVMVLRQLKDELHEKGNKSNKAVLLVLDDVEVGSRLLVEQCWNQISSNTKSKILGISRVEVPGLGAPVHMTQLVEDDAVTLLRHFVRSIGSTSYNIPDNTLRQVVKACGGFPSAIKIIGNDLQGKPVVYWTKVLKEMSQKGPCSLNTHSELLVHLKNSLSVLKDYKSNSEFFMDLGLFPENQMIPVTALIDMWVELYQQDEDGIDGMIRIHNLTAMNLAGNTVVHGIIGSNADDGYDSNFLTQDKILRELANECSSEQGGVLERRRLIIEINGKADRPEWWPEPEQSWVDTVLSVFRRSTVQLTVAAHIISISTDQEVTPNWCNFQAAEAEVLVLNLKTSKYTLPEFIKDMGNLKVLIVTNYGSCPTELSNLELLGSLGSLKIIRMQQVSVSSFYDLKNVRKLSLYMCEVKKAFEDSSIKFSEAMPNLAELSIQYCKDLVRLPAGLCSILTLKILNIRSCHKFTGLPEEIGNLEKLEVLRIICCTDFEEMPNSITELWSLKLLDISNCLRLKKLPVNIGGLQNLTKIYMTGCPISELPDSITQRENLESVIRDEHGKLSMISFLY